METMRLHVSFSHLLLLFDDFFESEFDFSQFNICSSSYWVGLVGLKHPPETFIVLG